MAQRVERIDPQPVRDLLRQRGITQRELARALGTNEQALSRRLSSVGGWPWTRNRDERAREFIANWQAVVCSSCGQRIKA